MALSSRWYIRCSTHGRIVRNEPHRYRLNGSGAADGPPTPGTCFRVRSDQCRVTLDLCTYNQTGNMHIITNNTHRTNRPKLAMHSNTLPLESFVSVRLVVRRALTSASRLAGRCGLFPSNSRLPFRQLPYRTATQLLPTAQLNTDERWLSACSRETSDTRLAAHTDTQPHEHEHTPNTHARDRMWRANAVRSQWGHTLGFTLI